ncbi:hypothetical protein GA0070624_3304 [Micromonospora rhizosphaerae]|uniref:Uncharacterized protein n=1 Tax=Micromonospora rhizosphaerae TaxID=568872 RepID=A0A1C6SAB4_9ACTN|nr:hypothetical protein GA0070624_3304 [Micromonospora rhizosphaerae]
MTGSPHGPAHRRDTGTDERNAPDQTTDLGSRHLRFSATHIVRPAAPASRPYGRYAVGLRPSPDPDASPRRAHNTTKKTKNKASTPLDRPRPFRDDLRILPYQAT